MSYEWVVHSFHINVGTGDSAIHIRAKASFTQPTPTYVYDRVVLIDGGDGNDAGYNRMQELISGLPSLYTNKPVARMLPLDAIVITHWDTDHWVGISRLMINNQSKAGKIPFLKSKDEGLTTIYAPDAYFPNGCNFRLETGTPPTITLGKSKKCAKFYHDKTLIGADFFEDFVPDVTALGFGYEDETVTIWETLENCTLPGDRLPTISLGQMSINGTYGPRGKTLSLQLAVQISPPDNLIDLDSTLGPSLLTGIFSYDSTNGWDIEADVADLSVAHIWQFFDSSQQTALIKVMGSIMWKMELRFEETVNQDITIKSLLGTLSPNDGLLNNIIEQAGSLVLVRKGTSSGLAIQVSPEAQGPKKNMNIRAEFHIDRFVFTYCQYTSTEENGVLKRFLLISLNQFEIPMPSIPVLKQFKSSFDSLYILWTDSDIKQSDLAALDPSLASAVATDSTMNSQDEEAFKAGFHTGIMSNGRVLLNHTFGQQTTEKTAPNAQDNGWFDPAVLPPERKVDTTSNTSTVKFQKRLGPLTMSNIGLKFESGNIVVVLGATLKVGPVEMKMMDFGLGLKLADLSNDTFSFIPSLSGLGLAIDSPHSISPAH
ncbi:transcriptional activator srcap [Fusarium agapanthi]|uniref:Transcriptional activator srcap n=1 Tax=Fusarium agapanthi TaxID=1803897 RepID=A0A9P5E2Q7_9HYPO|nr:transcriptional activator srcap [Fusarium agapanthi]